VFTPHPSLFVALVWLFGCKVWLQGLQSIKVCLQGLQGLEQGLQGNPLDNLVALQPKPATKLTQPCNQTGYTGLVARY
jgi:hypothetical protein